MSTLNDLRWAYQDELMAKRSSMNSIVKDWPLTERYGVKIKKRKIPKVAERLFDQELAAHRARLTVTLDHIPITDPESTQVESKYSK